MSMISGKLSNLIGVESRWRGTGGRRVRAAQLSPSEIMTILIHFHQSHYRTFKAYYTNMSWSDAGLNFRVWSATTGLSS